VFFNDTFKRFPQFWENFRYFWRFMADWIPKPNIDASAKFAVTVPALVANPTDYGLIAGDVDELAALRTAFDDGIADVTAAKSALAAAVGVQDAARAALELQLRPLVKRAQESPATSDASRTAAGIPIRDTTRSVNAPVAPAVLVAVADGATGARLSWNSNGNTPGVDYVVEKLVNNAGGWVLVDILRRTSLAVAGLGAGVRVDFRVSARRGAVTSASSNLATLNA
jgi:hypothetical protein